MPKLVPAPPLPKTHEEVVDQARVRLAELLRQRPELAWTLGAVNGHVQDVVIVLLDEIDRLRAEVNKLKERSP